MARMFCTVKEAAAWLNTSESNVRTMLETGVVPEFRSEGGRLLRISDVRSLVRSQSQETLSQPESASVGSGASAQAAPAPEIKLPLTGVAMLETPADEMDSPAEWDVAVDDQADELDWRWDGSEPDLETEMPVFGVDAPSEPARRPQSPAEPLRASQGIWMGVIDDRPLTLLGLSALAIAIASALASAAYFLIKFLQ